MNSTMLPDDFVPGPKNIVCQRGKSYWDHEGNKMYRAIIAAATPKYAKTTSKLDKSLIVSEIIQSIQTSTEEQEINFVKIDSSTGKWVGCDDYFVREKISQSLRDGLHGMYRSSTTAKKRRRRKASESINARLEKVLHSNNSVSQKIAKLSWDLESAEGATLASDCAICTMLSRANSDILESIKRDDSLLQKFQEATFEAVELAQ